MDYKRLQLEKQKAQALVLIVLGILLILEGSFFLALFLSI